MLLLSTFEKWGDGGMGEDCLGLPTVTPKFL